MSPGQSHAPRVEWALPYLGTRDNSSVLMEIPVERHETGSLCLAANDRLVVQATR